jgi:iron complex transport system substrate-binding protein
VEPDSVTLALGAELKTKASLAALAAGLVLLFGALAVPPANADQARRIVSLNLCVDQILLDLVPRERIAGVSFLASDRSMSMMAREAEGLPAVRGSAEEIIALDPDLILAGEYTTPATVDLLRRLGRRVEVVPMATNFDGIRKIVTLVGDLSGEPGRAAELVKEFDDRLAEVKARAVVRSEAAPPRAVAMQVNSLASGEGSLVDEVLREAGFENAARNRKLGPAGQLPLESLIADPPDVIVRANSAADFRTVLADNLRHPAFRALDASRPGVTIPMNEWLCGTPRIIDAVERLAVAREELHHRAEARR